MTLEEIELSIAGYPPESVIFVKPNTEIDSAQVKQISNTLDRISKETKLKFIVIPPNLDLFCIASALKPIL